MSKAAHVGPEAAKPETLDEIVARRAEFLTAYQDAAYAGRYRALVEKAHKADADFGMAVAHGAFKLMAYKDEYEVARLHRDRSFAQKLAEQFEGDFTLKYHLAPPMISRIDARTGHPGKIAFGAWMGPVFGLLARFKGLRGTRFDPFGRTEERRLERQLIADYFALVEDLAARLSTENRAVAIELAKLPEEVRGFGHVKLAAVERYEKRRAALMVKVDAASASPSVGEVAA